MGKNTTSRDTYCAAVKTLRADGSGPVTRKAEQEAHKTGKLNPLVDPAGFGIIRRSLPRLEKQDSGLWLLTVGTPMPIETRVDTTGSMGNNVDIAFRVLPDTYEQCGSVLPGYDIQIATGIFGDVCDNFVLCRPQFEMEALKIVAQMKLMVPERNGGDATEDPQYGLFGAAYLTYRHINQIGLKGYDFTVSDAPGRTRIDADTLKRVFGNEVFDKAAENGHQINPKDIPSTKEAVRDLLRDTHAFFLQVESSNITREFWTDVFGKDRIVTLPDTELLPQVQASIIGLTEGTLALKQVEKFLTENNVSNDEARQIARSVANIPIGAQVALPNFSRRPRKGDLFKNKTDPWPVNQDEAPESASEKEPAGPTWL